MRFTADSPNLDLLRSLAVTYVVVLHLLLFFKGEHYGLLGAIGFWGVLLFFVHTSLVLMFSLERQQAKFPEANLAGLFYVRRCFRILPLSMLVVTAVAVFRWPSGSVQPGRFHAIHLSALGLISNLFLVQNLAHAGSITVPLWSLPYEMQMYLIFPVLYLFVRAVRKFQPVAGLWFATAAAAYVAQHVLHGGYPSFIALAPCFMAGIVTYRVCQMKTTSTVFIGLPVVIVIAACFCWWREPAAQRGGVWCIVTLLPLAPFLMTRALPSLSGKLGERKLPFIGWPAMILLTTYLYLRVPTLVCGWIWCLVIGLCLPCFSEMSSKWLQTLCHTIARYSYGIYLVHFSCIWLAFEKLGKLPVAARWLVFMMTVAAVPVILYHFLEAPMISLGRRITDRLAARAAKVRPSIPAATVVIVDGDVPLTTSSLWPSPLDRSALAERPSPPLPPDTMRLPAQTVHEADKV
jgi:peptidoglycan/LPS O-acetylase OafA/YrhL